jgi:hypothetical protein
VGGTLVTGYKQQERCADELIGGQLAVLAGDREPPEQVGGGVGSLLLADQVSQECTQLLDGRFAVFPT